MDTIYNLRIDYPNEQFSGLTIDKEEGLRSEEIVMVQADMLSENNLLGHIPLMLEEFNLDIKFYYDLRGYKLLNNYLIMEQHSWISLREIYIEIINIILNSSKYLLDVNKYILKLPLIYINSTINKPHLIYLPLKNLKKEVSMADEFKQLFIDIFKGCHDLELNFYNSVIEYFDCDDFTIEGLYIKTLRDNLNVYNNNVKGLGLYEIEEPVVISDRLEKNIVINKGKRKRIFNWLYNPFFRRRYKAINNNNEENTLVTETKNNEEKLAETRILFEGLPNLCLERKLDGQMERIYLDKQNFIIGRNRNSVNYCEDSKEISRVHLEIIRDNNGYLIKDLDSKNGSFLNGVELDANKLYPIDEGDRITLATIEYNVKSLLNSEGDCY